MDRDFELDALTPQERDALLQECRLLPAAAEFDEHRAHFQQYLAATGRYVEDGGPRPPSGDIPILDVVRRILGEEDAA